MGVVRLGIGLETARGKLKGNAKGIFRACVPHVWNINQRRCLQRHLSRKRNNTSSRKVDSNDVSKRTYIEGVSATTTKRQSP